MLNDINRSRELRSVLGAIGGIDPRKLWDLPGDYDSVHLDTPEMREKILHRFNVYKKWTKAEC